MSATSRLARPSDGVVQPRPGEHPRARGRRAGRPASRPRSAARFRAAGQVGASAPSRIASWRVGRSRRRVLPSIRSSWTSMKAWKTSRLAAAVQTAAAGRLGPARDDPVARQAEPRAGAACRPPGRTRPSGRTGGRGAGWPRRPGGPRRGRRPGSGRSGRGRGRGQRRRPTGPRRSLTVLGTGPPRSPGGSLARVRQGSGRPPERRGGRLPASTRPIVSPRTGGRRFPGRATADPAMAVASSHSDEDLYAIDTGPDRPGRSPIGLARLGASRGTMFDPNHVTPPPSIVPADRPGIRPTHSAQARPTDPADSTP